MYRETDNPQVNYSLRELSEALLRMLAKKPFSEISVTALCREAGITRRTYYRNCQCMEDLVDYQIALKLRAHLKTADLYKPDPILQYTRFFAFWQGEREFLTLLMQAGLFGRFHRVMTELCVRDLQYPYLDGVLSLSRDREQARLFVNAFIIGGLCNLLAFWTQEGFAASPGELASIVQAFSPEANVADRFAGGLRGDAER